MGYDDGALQRIESRLEALAEQQRGSRLAEIVTRELAGFGSVVGREVRAATKSLREDVRSIRTEQDAQRDQLATLLTEVAGLREESRRTAIVSMAQQELTRAEAEMRERFRRREDVRATARSLVGKAGPLYASDLAGADLVREITGSDLFREPDYWLAPAVFAVAASMRGDVRAETAAWSLAQPHDVAKAELFCSLVYARLGRSDEASAHPMNSYLGHLDPNALGREFVHVLNALAEGELGEKAFGFAQQRLVSWSEQFLAAQGEELTTFCVHQVLRHHTALAIAPYHPLPASTPSWARLEQDWREASATGAAARHLRERLGGPRIEPPRAARRPHSYEALNALIGQREPDELEVLSAIRRWKLIISNLGDVRAAEAEAALDDPYSATVAFPTLLVEAAFGLGGQIGTEGQRLALSLTRPWLAEAGERVSGRATAARPDRLDLAYDRWRAPFQVGRDGEAERLGDDVSVHLRERTAAVLPRLPQVLAAAAGVISMIVGATQLTGLTAAAAVVLGLLFLIAPGHEIFVRLPRERAAVRQSLAEEQRRARAVVAASVAQAENLLADWDAEIADGRAALTALFAELPGSHL